MSFLKQRENHLDQRIFHPHRQPEAESWILTTLNASLPSQGARGKLQLEEKKAELMQQAPWVGFMWFRIRLFFLELEQKVADFFVWGPGRDLDVSNGFFCSISFPKTTFFLGILDVMSTGGLMVVVKKSLKAEVVYLGCPRKLGSMVSKKVVTLIYPIYKYRL